MIRSLLFLPVFLLPTSLGAQTIGEMQANLRQRVCPSNVTQVEECSSSKVCRDQSDFFRWQACEQQCEKDYRVQSEYNRFLRECERAQKDREAKSQAAEQKARQGKPYSTSSSSASEAEEATRRLEAQKKKSANAAAENAANEAKMKSEIKTEVQSAQDRELEAARKDVAARAAADAARRAEAERQLQAQRSRTDPPVIPPAKDWPTYATIPERVWADALATPARNCRQVVVGRVCDLVGRPWFSGNEKYGGKCYNVREHKVRTRGEYVDIVCVAPPNGEVPQP